MTAALLALALGVQAVAPQPKFDSGRAWEHLRQLVAIGPRPSGSAAIEQTRKYIKAKLEAEGLAVVEQAWDERTPIDRVHMVNLIVTIPGTHKDRLVIAGHYDTKLTREFRFVGASDGGSSAAFLIEMARVLKARRNGMTIELVFLDGEEARLWEWQGTDNTYGSRHYVETARRDGSLATLKAMVLVDMNAPDSGDISTAQGWADDLLSTSRLYRQDAIEAGEQSVATVLDDLERSLLEIVHSPSRISAADLEQIRRRIDAAALLFKVRVMSDELRERESRPAGTSSRAPIQKTS